MCNVTLAITNRTVIVLCGVSNCEHGASKDWLDYILPGALRIGMHFVAPSAFHSFESVQQVV